MGTWYAIEWSFLQRLTRGISSVGILALPFRPLYNNMSLLSLLCFLRDSHFKCSRIPLPGCIHHITQCTEYNSWFKDHLIWSNISLLGQFHILLGQTYKTLGIGVIVLGAADTLMSALVIILGQHSIFFNQWHTSLGTGAIILDAADKLLCVEVIIFG